MRYHQPLSTSAPAATPGMQQAANEPGRGRSTPAAGSRAAPAGSRAVDPPATGSPAGTVPAYLMRSRRRSVGGYSLKHDPIKYKRHYERLKDAVGDSLFPPSAVERTEADFEGPEDFEGGVEGAGWPFDATAMEERWWPPHDDDGGAMLDGTMDGTAGSADVEALEVPPVSVHVELAGPIGKEHYDPFSVEAYPRLTSRAMDYGLPDNLSYTGSHCHNQVETSRLGAWEVYMVTAFDEEVYAAHPDLPTVAGIWSKLFTRKWASPEHIIRRCQLALAPLMRADSRCRCPWHQWQQRVMDSDWESPAACMPCTAGAAGVPGVPDASPGDADRAPPLRSEELAGCARLSEACAGSAPPSFGEDGNDARLTNDIAGTGWPWAAAPTDDDHDEASRALHAKAGRGRDDTVMDSTDLETVGQPGQADSFGAVTKVPTEPPCSLDLRPGSAEMRALAQWASMEGAKIEPGAFTAHDAAAHAPCLATAPLHHPEGPTDSTATTTPASVPQRAAEGRNATCVLLPAERPRMLRDDLHALEAARAAAIVSPSPPRMRPDGAT